jgi:hypothetical protein
MSAIKSHAIGQLQRRFEALGEALLQVGPRLEAVDDGFDRVLHAQLEFRHGVDLVHHAVHAHAHVALRAQRIEHLRMLALAVADHRGQQHQPLVLRHGQHGVDHLPDGLRLERCVVVGAARRAHAGVQQAQVVVDLGDRADRRARVVRGRLLLDRDGRGQALDVVEVRLLHHRQELPRVGRQRLDVAALALGIDGVEGQRALAGPGQPVITISLSRGRSRSTFLRLWVRAPRMRIWSMEGLGAGAIG